MAKLIAELACKHDAEVLCGELLRRGLEPTAMEVVEGGGDAIIAFTILGDWTKGIVFPRAHLDPDYVELELERWKAKVRDQIAYGTPAPIVRKAISRYGREAVDRALKPSFAVIQA